MKLSFATQLLLVTAVLLLGSCRPETKDKAIKADIAAKAKGNLDFAGVDYVVDAGVVTLTGNCPSEASKQNVEDMVRKINIIKDCENEIVVSPVLIDADLQTKLNLDSILTQFPRVKGDVMANQIILKGKATQKEASGLMTAIQKWRPLEVKNEMNVE